ncbi:hypothetical protein GCM10007981_12080 [Thermocladium modestius]|uniref:Uncharacterized protein n=1 Tax=Thermocladium modestius TaxID=62609 RepID=A0A830GW86_9CREN|nr:hypothetical protein [Thermocladium modestius]GGP21207.1 hypothetical protein GCM10007981_12080 [Thermocladium modestius]
MAEKFDKYYEYFTRGHSEDAALTGIFNVINVGPIRIRLRPSLGVTIWPRRWSTAWHEEEASNAYVGEATSEDVKLIKPPEGIKDVKGEKVRVIDAELDTVEGKYVTLINVEAKKVVGDEVKLINSDVEELYYRKNYTLIQSSAKVIKKAE